MARKTLTPAQARAKLERAKADPERLEILRARRRRAIESIKADPVRFEAWTLMRRRADKAKRERIKADPERMKEYRDRRRRTPEQDRAKNDRIAADPIRAAAYRARRRATAMLRKQRRAAALVVRDVPSSRALALRDATYSEIWAALPKHMPDHIREDVASEAMIALLAGEASSAADAVNHGRRAHYRAFTKFGGPISMDHVEPGERSLHERLSVGLW